MSRGPPLTKLITTQQISRPDDIYEALVNLHRGLDENESRLVNARLIFLLANHIGDETVLTEAIQEARLMKTAE